MRIPGFTAVRSLRKMGTGYQDIGTFGPFGDTVEPAFRPFDCKRFCFIRCARDPYPRECLINCLRGCPTH